MSPDAALTFRDLTPYILFLGGLMVTGLLALVRVLMLVRDLKLAILGSPDNRDDAILTRVRRLEHETDLLFQRQRGQLDVFPSPDSLTGR